MKYNASLLSQTKCEVLFDCQKHGLLKIVKFVKSFYSLAKLKAMLPIDFSIDLHTHPAYKPFGKSFGGTNPGAQSSRSRDKNNLYYYDPPSLSDKLINYLGGLTKFSQANLTAAIYGKLWVMAVSVGSIEKGFFDNKLGTSLFSDLIGDFASGIGKDRINVIQNIDDYWQDLQQELSFWGTLNEQIIQIDGKKYTYKWVNNFSALEQVMLRNADKINNNLSNEPLVIALIPTIEGMHFLNTGLGKPINEPEVLNHAHALKTMTPTPWFVSLTHHFNNQICGHSKSLKGIMAKCLDQSAGLNTGFTNLGLKVLDILLDNTGGQHRILIDIKHLSPLGRKEYFDLLQTKYLGVPIIISHGVCNGLPTHGANFSLYPDLGADFEKGEINFYDDEIILMAKSGGIMGLQLDERRIANEEKLKRTKHSAFRNKIMHYRSELLWNQIQYIGELLDKNGLYAWGNIAIGSDYDGIVDPINSFWTAEQYPDLKSFVERYAYTYFKEKSHRLKNSFNKIEADELVQNIFQNNAWRFFQQWF
mgnify:CR=1 FL=1